MRYQSLVRQLSQFKNFLFVGRNKLYTLIYYLSVVTLLRFRVKTRTEILYKLKNVKLFKEQNFISRVKNFVNIICYSNFKKVVKSRLYFKKIFFGVKFKLFYSSILIKYFKAKFNNLLINKKKNLQKRSWVCGNYYKIIFYCIRVLTLLKIILSIKAFINIKINKFLKLMKSVAPADFAIKIKILRIEVVVILLF